MKMVQNTQKEIKNKLQSIPEEDYVYFNNQEDEREAVESLPWQKSYNWDEEERYKRFDF